MAKFFSFFFLTLTALTIAGSNTALALNTLDIRHHLVRTETPLWLENAGVDDLFSTSQSVDAIRAIDLGEIVNLGKEIWAIIEENKAVANVSYLYANALPKGVRSDELDNFSDIQSQSFRAFGKNVYGSTVYDVTYTIVHRYNGSYRGKGKYLENVSVIPSSVKVLWGYKLDINVTKANVVNVGTQSKPIGSLALELTTRVQSVMKVSETRNLFQFRGDSKDFKKL